MHAGFAITQLANLREQYVSAPQRTTVDAVPARVVEVGAGGITFLHFVHGDNVLLATGPAMQGGIAIWQFTSLIDGSNVGSMSRTSSAKLINSAAQSHTRLSSAFTITCD